MDHNASYTNELVGSFPLKIVGVPGKGRGVVTIKPFKKGEVVFTERPWISMQQTYNRAMLTVPQTCGYCLKFLGNEQEQLNFLESRLTGANASSSLSKVVQCDNHCGELFCSDKCKNLAATSNHNFLCVGPLWEDHPLVEFKMFAMERNNNFLLAAKAIVNIVNVAASEGLDRALRPYKALQPVPWQVVVERRGDVTAEEMQEDLTKSFTLLQQGLGLVMNNAQLEILKKFLTIEFYCSFFGIFDLYTQTVQQKNPLQKLWENSSKNSLKSRLEKLLQDVAQVQAMQEDDDDGDDGGDDHDHDHDDDEDMSEKDAEFPNMDGIGLFNLIAFTNHSCVPNCEVRYIGDDFTASIVALRGIPEGEEITHSYIENENDYETRQEDLKVYGFKCDCPKCSSEAK